MEIPRTAVSAANRSSNTSIQQLSQRSSQSSINQLNSQQSSTEQQISNYEPAIITSKSAIMKQQLYPIVQQSSKYIIIKLFSKLANLSINIIPIQTTNSLLINTHETILHSSQLSSQSLVNYTLNSIIFTF